MYRFGQHLNAWSDTLTVSSMLAFKAFAIVGVQVVKRSRRRTGPITRPLFNTHEPEQPPAAPFARGTDDDEDAEQIAARQEVRS